MDLPVIDTPVAPRWVWMEEITYSHIPIATLITAFMVLAPIFEYIGVRRKDARYDRFALGLIWFSLILFSPGAALGTGIPMFLMGTYPEFWSRLSNIFFWPFFMQFVFFLGEMIFLFFGYYLMWNRLREHKGLHICFGAVAAVFGLLVQLVWDSMGSYMMTPGRAPFPPVNEPVAWSATAFFNPTFLPLFTHRFVGNISYTMLLTGGVFALRYLRAKDEEDKDYLGHFTNVTICLGLLAFFAMPFIGWWYARVIQGEAPVVFRAIMGGHVSPHFIIKMTLIIGMVLISATYAFARYRGRALRGAVTLGIAATWVVFHWHPALDWLPGGMLVWRSAYTVLLAGALAWLWLGGGRGNLEGRRWRWALFAAGLAAFFAFCLGGFVRERGRQPYSVYEQNLKPEAKPEERDRWLFYRSCVGCHHQTPASIEGRAGEDWTRRLEIERRRPGVTLSDEEAERIARYLKERAP